MSNVPIPPANSQSIGKRPSRSHIVIRRIVLAVIIIPLVGIMFALLVSHIRDGRNVAADKVLINQAYATVTLPPGLTPVSHTWERRSEVEFASRIYSIYTFDTDMTA